MNLKIKILGGGQEIGRNAIQIYNETSSLLLDYGILLNDEILFPQPILTKKLKGIIISHAHLDHTGGLPLIYSSAISPSLYLNHLTLELMELLLLDFIKISKNKLQFDSSVIKLIINKSKLFPLYSEFNIEDFHIKTYNAGHIPGSWLILIEVANKRILYTGDLNIYSSKLLKGADIIKNIDIFICETTYACVSHINRKMLENEFIDSILEILDNKGHVLIPSFSIGRSQEILCLLEDSKIPYPIYLDGMARKASQIMLNHPSYFRDYNLLVKAHKKVNWINSPKDRKKVLAEPSIIISPAGMLKGGAAIEYLRKIIRNEKNAIFFVGYLSKNTLARDILEKRIIMLNNNIEKVKARIDWFGFSSHIDTNGILDFSEKVSPEKIILIHGEEYRMKEMSKIISERINAKIIIPQNNFKIEI